MKFLKRFKLENLKLALQKAWQRMPMAVLLIIITFGLFLVLIYGDFTDATENIIHKTVFTIILTFFFSIGIYLFYEAGSFSKKIKVISQIDSFIFAGLFYYFFEENLLDNFSEEVFVYIAVTLVGVLSFVYIAPFIQSWIKKDHQEELAQQKFFDFSSLLTLKISMSVVVGVVIMLLGFAGLGALFSLFDLNFINEGNLFSTWATFSLSLIAPIFLLINLPQVNESENNLSENKFVYFLVNYIGLSAITIYFIILYAYTIKVLINFLEWPQGKISWLVIAFSVFGYLIYFAVYNFTKKLKAVRIFQKVFPILVLPQLAMLFYAIFLRINQHDWTINRYLVVAFGIWLTVVSCYYIFLKKKYLSFVPASMTIFILIISLSGPGSIYIFPEHRQQDKLVVNLKKAKILQNKKIVPLGDYKNIDNKLSGEIYGSIEYLCKFHGCQTLDFVFKEEIAEIKKQDRIDFEKRKAENEYMKDTEYREINNWSLISKLSEKIKVRRYYSRDENYVPEFISFNTPETEYRDNQEIEVSGYDLLIRFYSDAENNFAEKYGFKIDSTKIEKKLAKRYQQGEFISNNNWDRYGFEIKPEDLTFNFETEKYFVKVQLNSLTIRNPDWKPEIKESDQDSDNTITKIHPSMIIGHKNGYVLLKKK